MLDPSVEEGQEREEVMYYELYVIDDRDKVIEIVRYKDLTQAHNFFNAFNRAFNKFNVRAEFTN
jgi:hypothetical protein